MENAHDAAQPGHSSHEGLNSRVDPQSQTFGLQSQESNIASTQNTPAAPSAMARLLDHPNIGGRGNQPVRAAILRQMQRSYGNRAVQRWLASHATSTPPGPQATFSQAAIQRGHSRSPQPKPGQNKALGVIQRKIGFEFQTSQTKTNFINNKTKAKVNEGKIEYYTAPGFTIEGDEGDLELVTKPFDETETGFQEMASTFSWMEVFASQIEGKEFPITELRDFFATAVPVAKNLKDKEHVSLQVEEKILTDPQTTVGMKLDKLLELAQLLANTQKRQSAYLSKKEGITKTENVEERTKPMLGSEATKGNLAKNIGWKAFEATTFQTMVKHAASEADEIAQNQSNGMKGFLFLVNMYSKAGPMFAKLKETAQYKDPYNAKLAIPIISRTNLADLFLKLPSEDKEWFANTHGKLAGRFGGEEGEKRPLFTPNLPGESYKSSFSVGDWLKTIIPEEGFTSETAGVDLSAVYESLGDVSNAPFGSGEALKDKVKDVDFNNVKTFRQEKEIARTKYKIGTNDMKTSTDIGKATDNGGDRLDGLIIELRKLGAKLTKNEWWPFASDVFKLTVMLNQNETRRDEIINKFISS